MVIERSERSEPMAPAGPPGRAAGAGRGDPVGPILVVDDEPYVLRWLAWHLTRAGYRVETAGDGESGLAAARALRPSLIFLGVRLPRLDGYAVCDELRHDPDPALAGAYVILFSAGEHDRGGGADAYLTKPCRPGEVLRRVRAVLGAPAGVA